MIGAAEFVQQPIKLAVFDAYGTLFDVGSPVLLHAARLGPGAAAVAHTWRTKQLEYSWVRSLAGAYADFWTLTEQALDWTLAHEGIADAQLRADLLAAYWDLAAYPEVPDMLTALREKGIKTAILTNGTLAMVIAASRSAGIDGLLDQVLTVESLELYKPDPHVYALVFEAFEVTPAEVSFQSSNPWDVAGAARFGFQTVWVNRHGAPPEYDFAPPTHTLTSLAPLPELIG